MVVKVQTRFSCRIYYRVLRTMYVVEYNVPVSVCFRSVLTSTVEPALQSTVKLLSCYCCRWLLAQRFCQSYMTELSKYVGPDVDYPGMGNGVTATEIGWVGEGSLVEGQRWTLCCFFMVVWYFMLAADGLFQVCRK